MWICLAPHALDFFYCASTCETVLHILHIMDISPCFFCTVLGLGVGLGRGQGQDPLLITGTRNILVGTKITVRIRATTVASGGHTTSGVEAVAVVVAEATSSGDVTNEVAEATITTTTTTTIIRTGKIISRNRSKGNHKDNSTMSRVGQEHLLRVSLIALTGLPHRCPDTPSILCPPHTPPHLNADLPCW